VNPGAAVVVPARQVLPDGSVVELGMGAEIGVDYSAALRHVILRQGIAHFEVQKNPARPFVVSANRVDVRAVGTAFDVRIESAQVTVTVRSGRVVVEQTMGATTGAAASAGTPRDQLPKRTIAVLGADNQVFVKLRSGESGASRRNAASPDGASEWAVWRSPFLEFTRTPLMEAISMLDEHGPASGARLVVADPGLAALRVTGVVRADNVDGLVVLLEGGFGVKAVRSGNRIILRSAR
jgi:transmembrane sensor